MLCSRCKKRMAVVFVSRVEEGKTIKEGLCIKCAREMGFNPVNDLFQNLGLDQDAMDEMNEQLTELLNGAEADQDFSEGGAPSVDLSADGLAKSEETPGKEKKQCFPYSFIHRLHKSRRSCREVIKIKMFDLV